VLVHADPPARKSTFTKEAPPDESQLPALAARLIEKLKSPTRPDLCIFFVSEPWQDLLGGFGDALTQLLPATCAVTVRRCKSNCVDASD